SVIISESNVFKVLEHAVDQSFRPTAPFGRPQSNFVQVLGDLRQRLASAPQSDCDFGWFVFDTHREAPATCARNQSALSPVGPAKSAALSGSRGQIVSRRSSFSFPFLQSPA